MPKKIEVELLGNFLVVWDHRQGSELYRMGYYGKPVGISKPKIPEFNSPLILDLMEGLYLVETGKISVREGADNAVKKQVGLQKLRRRAKRLYDEFEAQYAVYRDFREQGLIVTPGIKFGCDFAVYKQGPGVEHAPFMVSVKKGNSEITATEIVKAGRLATTVRKRFIIAVPDLERGRIRYLMFKWFKA
jgi:tRNA-intron endonuclease